VKHRVPNIPILGIIPAMILLLAAKDDWSTTHVVQFGGSFGFAYSPKTFSASVGDTVEWNGDFGMHPLSSTTIPAGAPTWHNATGTKFLYVITVTGTYNYQCDVHAGLGMVGSFEASGSAVRETGQYGRAGQTFAGRAVHMIAAPQAAAEFTIPHAAFVKIEIFDERGRAVTTPVQRMFDAGAFRVPINPRLAAGPYFARLSVDGTEIVGTGMIVNR
jgi:plastocyanin